MLWDGTYHKPLHHDHVRILSKIVLAADDGRITGIHFNNVLHSQGHLGVSCQQKYTFIQQRMWHIYPFRVTNKGIQAYISWITTSPLSQTQWISMFPKTQNVTQTTAEILELSCHYIPSISERIHNVIMNGHLLSEVETFPLLNWSGVGQSLDLLTHVSKRPNSASVDCSRALAQHHRVEDLIQGMFQHQNPTLVLTWKPKGAAILIKPKCSSWN